MKDYIAAWQVQTRWFEAERFSWKRYVESLMHPYDSNVRPVQVRKEGDSVFDDEEHVMVFHTSRPGWVNFSKDRFGWDSPHIQTEGPPGFTTRPRRMSPGGHGLHHPDKEFQWRGIPGMGADAGR